MTILRASNQWPKCRGINFSRGINFPRPLYKKEVYNDKSLVIEGTYSRLKQAWTRRSNICRHMPIAFWHMPEHVLTKLGLGWVPKVNPSRDLPWTPFSSSSLPRYKSEFTGSHAWRAETETDCTSVLLTWYCSLPLRYCTSIYHTCSTVHSNITLSAF